MYRKDLIFGFVSPVGTNLDKFISEFKTQVSNFKKYSIKEISTSNFIESYDSQKQNELKKCKNKLETISKKIEIGNKIREEAEDHSFFSKYIIAEIQRIRLEDPDQKYIFIVKQFKRPEEVALLRKIYDKNFFLVGVENSHVKRSEFLSTDFTPPEAMIEDLIKKDMNEIDHKYGQKTEDTFQLSDFYASENEKSKNILRFLDLIFQSPSHSPSKHEFLMFQAFCTSLRSGDLSRQVGAIILSKDGEILSQGANDVPKFGGGQYWGDDNPRYKDCDLKKDSNKVKIEEIINEVENLARSIYSDRKITEDTHKKFTEKLRKKTSLKDLTEFGRPVHAEMEAILSATRAGINIKNGSMYTTTFPCHNCAKHIIAAGIKKVYYIEAYPKSLARILYDDSVSGKETNDAKSLKLVPFNGISPNRFIDLFSMTWGVLNPLVRKNREDGCVIIFERVDALSRFDVLTIVLETLEPIEIAQFGKATSEKLKVAA